MNKEIKILSGIGIALVAYALLTTSNPVQYSLETVGLILLACYAWGYIKSNTAMLWMSGFFAVWYAFGNFSIFDLILWLLAFIFVLNKNKQASLREVVIQKNK